MPSPSFSFLNTFGEKDGASVVVSGEGSCTIMAGVVRGHRPELL